MTVGGDRLLAPGRAPLQVCNPIWASGPISHATRFSLVPGRYWTINLLPLGWARLAGIRACKFADRWEILGRDGPLSNFTPMLSCERPGRDFSEVTGRIDAHLIGMLGKPAAREEAIFKAHSALPDPAVTCVKEFAERVGIGVRVLERLSLSAFGFSPNLLFRRQRLLRSLAQFMLDPSIPNMSTDPISSAISAGSWMRPLVPSRQHRIRCCELQPRPGHRLPVNPCRFSNRRARSRKACSPAR